jgi:hypothetical protein
MLQKALAALSRDILSQGTGLLQESDMHTLVARKKSILSSQKSFRDRVFSYKTFHGVAMFTSWFNIVGRYA